MWFHQWILDNLDKCWLFDTLQWWLNGISFKCIKSSRSFSHIWGQDPVACVPTTALKRACKGEAQGLESYDNLIRISNNPHIYLFIYIYTHLFIYIQYIYICMFVHIYIYTCIREGTHLFDDALDRNHKFNDRGAYHICRSGVVSIDTVSLEW